MSLSVDKKAALPECGKYFFICMTYRPFVKGFEGTEYCEELPDVLCGGVSGL
jgi:hypothetical protein